MTHQFDGEPIDRHSEEGFERVERSEKVDETWMERLDAIAAGEELPSADDDELLYVAGQLSAALTPLRTLDSTAEARRQHVGSRLRTRRVVLTLKVWATRSLVLAAAVLIFLLLGPGLIFMVNLDGAPHHSVLPASASKFTAATGTIGTRAVPPALTPTQRIELIHAASPLPAHQYLIDSSLDFINGAFFRYYAQYRITGQGELDIFLYEQPASLFAFPVAPGGVQPITVRGLSGVSFRNDTGFYTIRWTEDGLTCQLASLLPISTLITFADQFQVVTLEQKKQA
ncbi:MAG TPA: hypothetical protein VKV40_02480 [Ktedonobacteraceae bacterium]|nr:hypothetical protein [Ktedonobacteraceae bacterium]